MEDWTHRTKGVGTDSTSQRDESAAADEQTRALQDVQDSVAREAQHGSSSSRSSASSSQAGFSLFGFSVAAGQSDSVATAASSTDASRSLGASENQDVHQQTEQHAQATRTRRASVVRESVEQDEARASTRVVANYNHMHALTVQYFEVVEVFEVETSVQSARPCIFVPFALMTGEQLVGRYPTVLADAAAAAGMDRVARSLRTLGGRLSLHSDEADLDIAVETAHASLTSALQASDGITGSLDALSRVGGRNTPRGQALPADDLTHDETVEMRRLANVIRAETEATRAAMIDAVGQLERVQRVEQAQNAENQQLRDDVAARIDEHRDYFNQAVWLRALTPRTVHLVLKDRIVAGEVLNDIIDPHPVAIHGNLVGFPLTSGKWLPMAEPEPSIAYEHTAVSEIALPTGGVFAEAVLGRSVSAELIDLSRFWKWDDAPIPIVPTELAPVDLAHTATPVDLNSTGPDQGAATLRPPAAMPDPAGLANLLDAVSRAGTFRDMSGLDAVKEMAIAAANHASSGAENAAENATKSFEDFANLVEKVLPMIMTDGASTLVGGLANQAAAGEGGAGEATAAPPAEPEGGDEGEGEERRQEEAAPSDE